VIRLLAILALLGCSHEFIDLDERCTCGPEIEATLETCTVQDQEVKSEVERQLFELRDRVDDELLDHEERLRALEGAP
jgi:hypothetical protein